MTDDRQNPPPLDDNQLITERRDKLATIRAQAKATGGAAFPNDFKPKHHALDLLRKRRRQPLRLLRAGRRRRATATGCS